MLAVVIYLFSPIDLIPDFLVILGITDDLVVISAAMWFLGKVVPEKVKNSLPMEPSDTTTAKQTSTKQTRNPSTAPVKPSPLKPFGIVLLVGVLIAALASHPWVQTQFSSIGSFF